MANRKLFGVLNSDSETGSKPPSAVPLGGTRNEAMQRLQVGIFGIFAMVLLVGLASIIGSQAELSERNAVPDAAPTTEPVEAAPPPDPLADAGLVPDIPAESPQETTEELPDLPEAGPDAPANQPDPDAAQ